MPDRLSQIYDILVKWLEIIVASILLIGVVISSIGSVQMVVGMDWGKIESLYNLISRLLLLVIGLELVRMLVTRNLTVVLELLAFIISRKILNPDLAILDVVLGIFAFVVLLAARRFLISKG